MIFHMSTTDSASLFQQQLENSLSEFSNASPSDLDATWNEFISCIHDAAAQCFGKIIPGKRIVRSSNSTVNKQVQEPATVRSPGPTMATSLALPGSVANNYTCGTLPVPPRLRDRIVRGEFVQFDDLLLESMSNTADEPLNLAVIGDGHLRIHRSSTEIKRRVCNLGTWLEAWTVFCRVLVDAAPELAPDVLQYQSTITEASAKYSEDAWLTYDRRFRMALAAQPHRFAWGVIDPNLWQSCMTGKALPSCPRCRLSHPTPGPFCPFRSGPSPAPSFGSGGPSRQTIFTHSRKPVCRNFNTGSCDSTQCTRAHVCFSCRGYHSAHSCRAGHAKTAATTTRNTK